MSAGNGRRWILALGLCISLNGCFQAQLNGSVAGSEVTITTLDNPDQVLGSAVSYDEAYMQTLRGGEVWAKADKFKRLLWIGIFHLQVSGLDDNRYYLVTARGSADADVDRNNQIDDAFTPVLGEWRAIIKGSELKQLGPKVTSLSEAVYQWLRPHLSTLDSAQLSYNLDRAALQAVSDINDDGRVNWFDALLWNRQLNAADFRGDLATVNQVADNVIASGSIEERHSLATRFLGIDVSMETEATPEQYFSDHIAGEILGPACQNCHVAGGPSGHTRLVFEEPGAANEIARNQEIFSTFLTEVENAGTLVLSKVQGVNHGGGTWFTSQSTEFSFLATYIALVTGDDGNIDPPAGSFWDGVTMADARQTLRRAALIFAGRLPTDAEYAQAETGEAGLRAAILALMEGEYFHDFLIRGANDRLHTDAFMSGLFPEVSDLNAAPYYPIGANKYSSDQPRTDEEWEAKGRWEGAWLAGIARAPLELIAHVVENDLPYTEILTADYTMVNWQSSEVLRSGVDFGGREDNMAFKPGRNRGQVYSGEDLLSDYVDGIGTTVYAHGPFIDYPHAGVLNTQAFLQRYPSTETNRNRARARWTYLHFLDVDIEKSASRTTDPEALADTNNPTMNNPACTVCHQVMDPVAGAFQNYGNEGWYRSSWNGHDALPDTYKFPEWFDENADPSPYREGDTWYRDMRTPGMLGQAAPDNRNSLQWLAQQIAANPGFARATVKFWWPAVMGANVLDAPGSAGDAGYQQLLDAFEQQTADVQTLANNFSRDNFNLKRLLVEMAMTGWFRANGVEPGMDAGRELALETVGTGRLLTPAELDNKNRSILGIAWDESRADWDIDGEYTALQDRYRIYYGGIDSFGVKERARQMTTLMANVAQRQAVSLACSSVVLDFLLPDGERRLFDGMDRGTSPLSEFFRDFSVAPQSAASAGSYRQSARLEQGIKRLRISFTNDFWDGAEDDRNLVIDTLEVRGPAGIVISYGAENLREVPGFSETENEWGASGDVHWGNSGPDGWMLWSEGFVEVPFTVESAGNYTVTVRAWAQQAGPEQAQMLVAVNSETPWSGSAGESAIRQKIAELHALMLSEELPADDTEIDIVYDLLVETWQAREERWPGGGSVWYWPEDNCHMPGDYWELDGSIHEAASTDPANMLGSWVSVIMYLMTHYSYLHE